MISAPDAGPVRTPRKGLSRRAWIGACALLVILTWTPVLALHLRNMSVTDPGTGTLVVVFPPMTSNRDMFRSITEARGAPVGPVSWAPSTWIVQSTESGFAGRLRERGALAVYSPGLLSARQVLSCTGMVKAPLSSAPAEPRPAS
jgi:hypothetical protein